MGETITSLTHTNLIRLQLDNIFEHKKYTMQYLITKYQNLKFNLYKNFLYYQIKNNNLTHNQKNQLLINYLNKKPYLLNI